MRDARVPVTSEFKDPVRCYGVWGKDMGILYSLKGISLKGKKDKKNYNLVSTNGLKREIIDYHRIIN